MSFELFLFCGGPDIAGPSRPKPLMRVREDRSLIVHFLRHLAKHRPTMPARITLLCDDGQEAEFESELRGIHYPVPLRIEACGLRASTFEKFEYALHTRQASGGLVQFGYPDIFFFDHYSEPTRGNLESGLGAYISAAPLTCRFPRLIVDVYSGEVKGISDYSSPVPANPMHVFGGDLWGLADELLKLASEFRSQTEIPCPSLEYNFFFWLINRFCMGCVMLHGERIWVDSPRDVERLLERTRDL